MSEVGLDLREQTAQVLAEYWMELLDVEQVAPGDRLVALGGNSLIATMLANRVELSWGFRPLMEDLLAQTLEELTAMCVTARSASLGPSGP